ncbi:MAG TPA: DNA repair protein RadC [Azoarcus taiwanensis]|nr:DNA repair protein RadC [Azoarcus taiwanensis]
MATADCTARREREDRTIARALRILERRVRYDAARPQMHNPESVKKYLRLQLGELEHEEFWVVWLDSQNRVIEVEMIFTGTLTQTSVYPREIVKRAMKHNAAAAILAHNHPSGITEPSDADRILTRALKETLNLIDVRVLDHFVIGIDPTPLSFAERGLL